MTTKRGDPPLLKFNFTKDQWREYFKPDRIGHYIKRANAWEWMAKNNVRPWMHRLKLIVNNRSKRQ